MTGVNMGECDFVRLEARLENLDRKASLSMACGQPATIDGHDLKKVVKAVRGLSAAKAAYNDQRQRLERQEASLARAVWFSLVISVTVMAVFEQAGFL